MDRGRDGPKRFLNEYGQVLLADGYAGYNGVVVGNAITRAGCWAHMKRKIIDAEKSAPEIAKEAVERVCALYAVSRMRPGAPAFRQAPMCLAILETRTGCYSVPVIR
jgi:transposase